MGKGSQLRKWEGVRAGEGPHPQKEAGEENVSL